MTLTAKQSQAIRLACENLEFKLDTEYSGRGMFGRICFGFSTNAPGAELKFAVEMLQNIKDIEEKDDVMDILERMSECACSDSLGLDTIYYYTRLQWSDNEDVEVCGICGEEKDESGECECI